MRSFRVALDDAEDFGAHFLVHVVRNGDAVVAVADELHGDVNALEEADGVDATQTKQPLSKASGRSVEERMHTAGEGWPTEVKNELSSGRVPLSDTTAKAFIWRQL